MKVITYDYLGQLGLAKLKELAELHRVDTSRIRTHRQYVDLLATMLGIRRPKADNPVEVVQVSRSEDKTIVLRATLRVKATGLHMMFSRTKAGKPKEVDRKPHGQFIEEAAFRTLWKTAYAMFMQKRAPRKAPSVTEDKQLMLV